MRDLHNCCSVFITKVALTGDNLPRWHAVAAKYGYEEATLHCRDFLSTTGNYILVAE